MTFINTRIPLLILSIGISTASHSDDVFNFQLPMGNKIKSSNALKSVQVQLPTAELPRRMIGKDFYGADSHGFSRLPPASLVAPLQLGYAKLGGSLHATYNWEYNAYHEDRAIHYVYAPLIQRLDLIKNYKAEAMFQVNMLGLQPDRSNDGILIFKNTADADHAGKAIEFINGKNKAGLKHILMGNEPFESEEYHDINIPSADDYIDKYIDYAMALRRSQEAVSGNPNDIKLWGPEINTGWTNWQTNNLPDCIIDYDEIEKTRCSYGNGKFRDFIPYFLYRLTLFEKDKTKNPKNYKLLDYLTIHYYPLFRTKFIDNNSILKNSEGYQDVQGMLEATNLWDSTSYINRYDASSPKNFVPKLIPRFKEWAETYYPSAKLSVTEFGIDSVDKINYHPIVRPLYLADFVARSAAAGLDTLINSFLQSGDISNSWAMIDKGKKTRLYHIYSLFTNFYLGEILKTTDEFGDSVNSYAVKTSTGTNIFLVNKDHLNHEVSVSLKGVKTFEEITELQIPGWSLTVLVVPDKKTALIEVHQYGAKEMGIVVGSKM